MLSADLSTALLAAARADRLLVTTDFDGTVAPIVNDPSDARALAPAVAALNELSTRPGTMVAVISGRALSVLDELARASGITAQAELVGSHGAEFPDGFGQPVDTALLAQITRDLATIAAAYPGVTVETKPASVALHVRRASAADGEAALAAARHANNEWRAEMTSGKAVLEFAVIDTDKGAAIDALRRQSGATVTLYFGDDVTDEKAFTRLGSADVGVKVGDGPTAAGYRVAGPEEVCEALQVLADARRS